jgi:hypothetical protein
MKLTSPPLCDIAAQHAPPSHCRLTDRTPMTQNVAQVLVDTLAAAGIKHCYGIISPGG